MKYHKTKFMQRFSRPLNAMLGALMLFTYSCVNISATNYNDPQQFLSIIFKYVVMILLS